MLLCLVRIVKSNDAAGPDEPEHIVENLFAGDVSAVVSGNNMPHDNLVFLGKENVLPACQPSVRRPEKI